MISVDIFQLIRYNRDKDEEKGRAVGMKMKDKSSRILVVCGWAAACCMNFVPFITMGQSAFIDLLASTTCLGVCMLLAAGQRRDKMGLGALWAGITATILGGLLWSAGRGDGERNPPA